MSIPTAVDGVTPVDAALLNAYKAGIEALTLPVLSSVCDARLTLTQGVPVTTSDVIGANNIYLTRYRGAHVALWDGVSWVLHEVPSGDVSLALSGLTAGKVYDVFLHDNAGTLTLSLSAAWADGTTRTDALAYQDGIRVLASDHARRLVGTICATGTDTTADAGYTVPAQRLVRNEAHPVQRAARVYSSTETRTYTTQEWRVWNNDANVVVQLLAHPSLPIRADVGVATQSSTTIGARKAGVGVDSLSALADGALNAPTQPAGNNSYGIAQSRLQTVLAEGYHYLAPLEWALATGTCTWYGTVDNNMEVTLWA